MIKKIIYIHETFYRKHRDMGIDIFREKGYEVELWSNLKVKYKKILEIPNDNTEDKVLYFKNHLQLAREIFKQDWKHTIAFFTTTAHKGGIEDFARIMIGLAGGQYCNFIYETLPIGTIIYDIKKSSRQKVIDFYNQCKCRFYQFIIKRYFKPKFCFVPTYQAAKNLLMDYEKKVVVEVHNKDYDEYLRSELTEEKEKYILFVDGDMINAEDFRKSNTSAIYPQASIYYTNIKKLFEILEAYYEMPVYIAAHPKSEYKGEEFGKRKIFYYQTCKLVQNAELVLTHASVSVNFIVLFRKPYIFLIDKYIKRHMIWKYITLPQIKELRAIPYYFDKENKPWEFINKPDERYDAYLKKYIKHSNSNGKLFYEIVEDTIRKVRNE